MSGHLSKFHFRLKQSVGNQSSQSELLPHSPSATMACGPGTFLLLTICRYCSVWEHVLRLALPTFSPLRNGWLHLPFLSAVWMFSHSCICLRNRKIHSVEDSVGRLQALLDLTYREKLISTGLREQLSSLSILCWMSWGLDWGWGKELGQESRVTNGGEMRTSWEKVAKEEMSS